MGRVDVVAHFREDRFHDAEAIGAHGHGADHCQDIRCASLTTESAADFLVRRLARGELSSSLLDATVAEVDARAGDHVSHFGLHAAAGGAGNLTERGAEASGDASSDSGVALHRACSHRRVIPTPEYPLHFLVKKVTDAGTFRFQRRVLYIANALVDQHLGLEETDDGIWSIYFNTILLATLDERDYIIRG